MRETARRRSRVLVALFQKFQPRDHLAVVNEVGAACVVARVALFSVRDGPQRTKAPVGKS